MFFRKNRLCFLFLATAFALLSVLLLLLVLTVDVQSIGVCDTEVGFALLNGAFHKLLPFREGLYKLTTLMGLITFLPLAGFGLTGLIQWIRRKNILQVDGDILGLGITYVITGVFYLLSLKVAVNYRPVLTAGETFPESSFPSSHTLLAAVICGTLILELLFRIQKGGLKKVLSIVTGIWASCSVLLRFLSGVHWFTDILGGLLLGAALVFLFGFLAGWIQSLQIRKK